MATYNLINSNVLSSSAASVTFSSIPATYTDLVLKISARADDDTVNFRMTFNGDTATNYSDIYLYGSGSTTSTGIGSTTSFINPMGINASSHTANTFGNAEVYIANYLASEYKSVGSYGAEENAASTAYIMIYSGLWRNTAAITSMSITPNSGNFVSTSSFYLYGISNA
jgi:hypothetical protein